MPSVFTPKHESLDGIFGTLTTYVIPSYQRPYSWQALGKSDKNNQVNQMWDDLWTFFQETPVDKEYFFGSMVIITKGLRSYEVIDGQQRLTTITLLFAAMRCFLEARTESEPDMLTFRGEAISTLKRLLYNSTGISLVQEQKVKIQRAAEGYDFNEVLGRAIGCTSNINIVDDRYREVAERYFRNRDYFIERLQECFLTRGHFTAENAQRFDKFFSFLSTRVSIVVIETTDFDTAYSIFEILNNRGLPLSNRDLLRNFLIKELDQAKVPKPAETWLLLEQDYALTEDFIGRWVESYTATKQQGSAFNELRKIYADSDLFSDTPVRKKVEVFYDTLRKDLNRYSLIVEADQRAVDLRIRNKIHFIRECGNDRYSMNFLMALFRHYDYDGGANVAVVDFLCIYQRWLLHVLLAPAMRFSSQAVYQAIRELRNGNTDKARSALNLDDTQRSDLIGWISGKIIDDALAKLLVAAFVWHEEVEHQDVVIQRLDYDLATLEHIIPQQPEAGSNWLHDFSPQFREEYTYRLGNMTLLTSRMNAAARHFDFSRKRTHYRKARLPMTVRLGELETITQEYIEKRHHEIVAGIRAELSL